jgi:hypothetical protein
MRSHFDDEEDEYADHYDVYLLPMQSENEFDSSPNYWMDLNQAFHLG